MSWTLKGEMIVNCNCEVFCPCVISLGQHPPTEGYCQAWFGVRIDEGAFEGTSLAGFNVGLLMDIPGKMSRGNYTLAGFIDERVDDRAFEGLERIFSGRAGGTTGLLSILVGEVLGFERATVSYDTEGDVRRFGVGKMILGEVAPIQGKDQGAPVTITNSEYWPASDIVVGRANKGRVRAFGRVWDFEDRSAEILSLDWHG
ncbi:MAG: DUF1326 domain-containing protein [Pseudomonadota bacterium]